MSNGHKDASHLISALACIRRAGAWSWETHSDESQRTAPDDGLLPATHLDRLSYRDLTAMMAEREVTVSHTTIMRWVRHYVPEYERRWSRFSKPTHSDEP